MELRNAVLVDGVRSAFARAGRGKLVATRLDEAAATVVRALLERNPKVKPRMIEDVGLGNSGLEFGGVSEWTALGTVARLAGLPYEVPNFMSARQCGSSMETMQRLASAIMIGAIDCALVVGIERMGPHFADDARPKNRITEPNPRLTQKTKEQRDLAPDHYDYFSVPIPDYILDSPPKVGMLQTAQNVAEMYNLTRAELDEFTVKSHHKYQAAYEAGRYKAEIIPLEIEDPVLDDKGRWLPDERGKMILFSRDECVRGDTNFERLMSLKPVTPEHGCVSYGNREIVITAGNSCPLNDGVSAALVMSEKKALELGLEPLARFRGFGIAGVKPQVMGIGPVPSTKRALRHAGITADQIDRVEF
ncbi:MAG: thiolase family protein, partial [Chloroflexi bacterium]|nr:thiolase family protein [Chloroflexota bacterium]